MSELREVVNVITEADKEIDSLKEQNKYLLNQQKVLREVLGDETFNTIMSGKWINFSVNTKFHINSIGTKPRCIKFADEQHKVTKWSECVVLSNKWAIQHRPATVRKRLRSERSKAHPKIGFEFEKGLMSRPVYIGKLNKKPVYVETHFGNANAYVKYAKKAFENTGVEKTLNIETIQ